MEEKAPAPTPHEPPKPIDRMAKARAALAQKRAADKLITLQREAEKIEQKIKDADEYSKTNPPVPMQQPMQVEEVIQTPIIHEEKTIENENPPIQQEPVAAKTIQETIPMSSSEDIIVTPISKENEIKPPRDKKKKTRPEKITKKRKHEAKSSKSSSNSEDEEAKDQPIEPPRKKFKLVATPIEPLPKDGIFSRVSERANQIANGIRSLPIPDSVTNYARDTATNCGWACVVFAGVLLQRYAFQAASSYIFPGGRYPGHANYPSVIKANRIPESEPHYPTQQPQQGPAPTWLHNQNQQQSFSQPRYSQTNPSNPGWIANPHGSSLRSNQGSVSGGGAGERGGYLLSR